MADSDSHCSENCHEELVLVEQDARDYEISKRSPGDKVIKKESDDEQSVDGEAENESYFIIKKDEKRLYEEAAKAANIQDSEWQCDICDKRYKDQQYLRKHFKTHKANETKQKEQCEICRVDFGTKELRIHMKSHDPQRPLVCKVCNLRYNTYNGLIMHIRSHANRVVTFCPECGLQCNTLKYLNNHMRRHDYRKDYPCHLCGKNYKTAKTLQAHLQTCGATGLRPAQCHLCEKSYKRVKHLNAHLRTHHQGSLNEELLQCHLCEKIFVSAKNLQAHLDTFHKDDEEPGSSQFNCDQCSKSFASKRLLKKHQKVHIKPFRCPLCQYASRWRADLEKHLAAHNRIKSEGDVVSVVRSKRRYLVCPYCYQEFERNKVLVHIRTIHNKETPSCTVCGQEFRTSYHLKNHKSVHNDRQCSCQICGRVVASKGHLKNHMKSHKQTPVGTRMQTDKLNPVQSNVRTHRTKVQTNARTDVQTNARTDVQTNKRTDVQTNARTDVQTNARTNVQTNARTDVQTNESTDVQTNARTDVQTNARTDVQTNAWADVQTRKRYPRHEKKPICNFCGQIFKTITTMKAHIREKHSLHECKCCGKIFKKRPELKKHMMGHELERKFGQPLGVATTATKVPPSATESRMPSSVKLKSEELRTPLTVNQEPEESQTPFPIIQEHAKPSGNIEICPENPLQHHDHPMEHSVHISPEASICSASEMSCSSSSNSSQDTSQLTEATNTAEVDSFGHVAVVMPEKGLSAEISRVFAKSQPSAVISDSENPPECQSDRDASEVLEIVPMSETIEAPNEERDPEVKEFNPATKVSASEVGLSFSSSSKSSPLSKNSNSQREMISSGKAKLKSQIAESAIGTAQTHDEKSKCGDSPTDFDDTDDSDTDFDDMQNPLNDDSDIECSDTDSENEKTESSMDYDDTDICDTNIDDTDYGDTDVEMESDDTDATDTDINANVIESPSVRPESASVRPESPSVRPESPSVRPESPSVRP